MEVLVAIAILFSIIAFAQNQSLQTRVNRLEEAERRRQAAGGREERIRELAGTATVGQRSQWAAEDAPRTSLDVPAVERHPRRKARSHRTEPPPAPAWADASSVLAETVDLPVSGVEGPLGGEILPPQATGVGVRETGKPLLEPVLERIRTTDEWEALIGGRWMNRLGALALILGMGFFFKYAVDNNWISEQLRVAFGILVGLGLLAGGRESYRRDLEIFGGGLTGAGLAILYLAIYASSSYYHLVPQPVALTAMAAVTAGAFVLALVYDSLAVSLLATAGGFLAVPLLGITPDTQIGAIGYVLLLDAGILALVYRRDTWFILEPIAMAATYAIYFGWYAQSFSGDETLLASIVVALVWALFFASDVSRVISSLTTYRDLRHSMGASNIVVSFAAFALVLHDQKFVLGGIVLGQAAAYIGTILLARHRLKSGDLLDARYTLTAIILAIIATPIVVTGFAVPLLWSLEALALLWCGVRWNLSYVWWPAVILYGLTSAALLAVPGALQAQDLGSFVPFLNTRALAFAVLAASLAAGSIVLRRLPHAHALRFVSSLQYAWCATIFLLLAVETNDFFGSQNIRADHLTTLHNDMLRSLVLALAWLAYGLPLIYGGLQRRIFPVLSSGLAVTGLAVGLGAGVGISYAPIERFTPVANVRVLTLVLLMCGLGAGAFWLRQQRDAFPWIDTAISGYRAVILLLGFELVSSEIHDYFRHASGAVSESAGPSGTFIEIVTLSAIWLLYSFPMVRYGIRNRALSVLLIGLGSLASATGAGAIAAVIYAPETWLSTALALRPVILLALGAGLLLQIRWVREGLRVYPWLDGVLLAMQACTVLIGFELITTQTRDVFDHQVRVSAAKTHDDLRNLEQLTLSILWLVYGIVLLVIGLWRRVRWIRLGALAMMAFAMGKIVLYDLSFLNPAFRSLSFVGLGVVLLGASYLYTRYRSLIVGDVQPSGA